MALTLDLTPEEETRLQTLAAHHGMDLSKFARQKLGLERRVGDAVPQTDAEWDALQAALSEGVAPVLSLPETEQEERIADLNPGSIWVSEDFDAPLPDEFWEGK